MRKYLSLALLVVAALSLWACQPSTPEAASTTGTTGTETPAPTDPKPTEPSTPPTSAMEPMPLKFERDANGAFKTAPPEAVLPKDGDKVAVLYTNQGNIILRFDPKKAPKHVAQFQKLVEEGFYTGTKFHRVIPGFMIQGGDPNSKDDERGNDGMGGYMKDGVEVNVPAEFNDTKHIRGILSAARSTDPNSASSQFFIMVDANENLNGQYSAYGQVVAGMDTVDKIVNLPRDMGDNPLDDNPAIILKAEIRTWPLEELK
ncbi:MAG TPA: peptidylprolyl isomerase [Fimbriimonadaceae bacterium]|nr:peptidylprolyl isomerase [Fimbriimonadaceae bacterium]HRE94360.1 peptidylprolyl isomerase [Fimbriimonadaceae bacterium]HRI75014.1 peptidylprolyl isomerase [Fimbriimonadaceae bacterium]